MDFSSFFLKQNLMRKVLWSLIPLILLATYSFGLRVLLVLTIVIVLGVGTEYLMLRKEKNTDVKVTEAVLVTCALFALTLPPGVPYWVAGIGIVFGVLFGKAVFGGFGKNVFNPALLGRCFIFISFPSYMTVSWAEPFSGFPGGLVRLLPAADALTAASPLMVMNASGEMAPYINLFMGRIPGSIGEISAFLILLSGAYLVYTKTASWKIMVSAIASFSALSSILYLGGMTTHPPLFALLSGGFLFATVYMATDPVTAPTQDLSRIFYGCLIGCLTTIIRTFAVFVEGAMFAILIANTFVPLIDLKVKEFTERKVSS